MMDSYLQFSLFRASDLLRGQLHFPEAMKGEPMSDFYQDEKMGTGVSTDSRTAQPGDLFFALSGGNFDGHAYVNQAFDKGCVAAVVDHIVPEAKGPLIVVPNVGEAYGQFAHDMRAPVPVVMVVGSNGKTTTTQMIATALRSIYGEEHVDATQGNFNNEVGVPKTLLSIEPGQSCAVVEAGINHPGEMARLVSWIEPKYVVITNAHREHQEFLAGARESARENGLAILRVPPRGSAIVPADDPEFPVWRDLAKVARISMVTYSMKEECPALVEGRLIGGTQLQVTTPTVQFTLTPNNTTPHHLHNVLSVLALIWAMGLDYRDVAEALENFSLLDGRGAIYRLKEGALTVIDEAYNANPDSVKATLLALSQKAARPRTYVLGDMGELGPDAPAMHAEVGAYAKSLGIEALVTVGSLSRLAAEAFGEGAVSFDSVDEAYAHLADVRGVITVKASHFMRLDRLVDQLTGRRVEKK